MSSDRLLPPGATPLERAIGMALARMSAIATPAGAAWTAATCPAQLLPHLAWGMSVDTWDPTWTEARKRAAIAASVDVHRHKGTAGAVRTALQALNRSARAVEWHQETPPAEAGTFAVEFDVSDDGAEANAYAEIRRVAEATKNARSHLTRISAVARQTGGLYIGGVARSAQTMTLYPVP